MHGDGQLRTLGLPSVQSWGYPRLSSLAECWAAEGTGTFPIMCENQPGLADPKS